MKLKTQFGYNFRNIYNIQWKYNIIYIFFIFSIIIFISFFPEISPNSIKINLKKNENGYIQILNYRDGIGCPSKLSENNNEHNDDNKCNPYLYEGEHNIVIEFNNQIVDCSEMFKGLNYLIEIDLSGLDSSNIEYMGHMFKECKDLVKVILPSINKENQLKKLNNMFEDCFSLRTIEFSGDFYINKVDSMAYMFKNCHNLISINFPENFKTHNLIHAQDMFFGCYSLNSIKFEIFSTDNIVNMACLFRDIKLTSFSLNHFKTHNVELMQYMFYNCSNVKSLDLSNFNWSKVNNMEGMFGYNNNLEYINFGNSLINDNTIVNDIFINSNKKMVIYVNKKRPEDFFNNTVQFTIVECGDTPSDIIMNSYTENKIVCVESCNNLDNYKYKYNNRCLKSCPGNTITDNINYICQNFSTTIVSTLPKSNPILTTIIPPKTDEKLKTTETNNDIIETYMNEIEIIEIKDERDKIIEQYRKFVSDFNVSENKEDIIKSKDNVTYQMTTTDNQKNNTNKNISTINLGKCEEKLKTIYGIDNSLPLIIFKIDYFSPDTLIPIIGYEIYHPINKSKLNLSYCEDILIKLNIPANIDESKLFKYDPNSEFYTDNCFSYTTENGTDIILNDRKQEFTNNNLSLCESNCNYTGYDINSKQSSCDCNVKNKMDLISDIIEKPIKLSNNFDTEEGSSNSGSSNIISIKCTKALFSKEGLKNNISSYILIIFISHFLLSILLFIKCDYQLLNNIINKILNEKEKAEKLNKNQETINNIGNETKKNNKKKSKRKKLHGPPKKYNINFINNMNSIKGYNQKSNSNISKLNKNIGNLIKHEGKSNINTLKTNGKNIASIIKSKKIKLSFNDFELNNLNYKNALSYDKRTCCEYYFSLLKAKNPIIFSFCPIKDYNSIIIKLCIFSISFSVYYAINFAFFDDNIMHKIYEMGGKYNVLYFIPKIAISFIASYYITVIIKLIFLSERNIFIIRMQPTLSLANDIASKEKKNLVIKYIIFFIGGLIFLGFFWMLLSSFGAVYPNTQMLIFKNALISFSMSLFYPLIINIFPCFFRRCSLNSKKKNNECMYKLSKFLQVL